MKILLTSIAVLTALSVVPQLCIADEGVSSRWSLSASRRANLRSLYSRNLMGKKLESLDNDSKDPLQEDQEAGMFRMLGEDEEGNEGGCPGLDEVTRILTETIDELDGEDDDKEIDRDELHAALAAEGLTEMCMDEALEVSIFFFMM